MIANTTTSIQRAEYYLLITAVRKGEPVGYEMNKPLNELKLTPCVLNAADPELLPRMTKRESPLAWLRNRVTQTPAGV